MKPRKLFASESLFVAWDETTYTEARLLQEPLAAAMVADFSSQIDAIEVAMGGQRSAWRVELRAEAFIEKINYRLDRRVSRFATTLRVVLGEGPGAEARYGFYFQIPPHKLIRLALEPEIKITRTWPEAIAQEPQAASLQEFRDGFTQDAADADQALTARVKAVTARKLQRRDQIEPLFQALNKLRQLTHGRLTALAAENDLPTDWADGFFKRRKRSAPEAQDLIELRRGAILQNLAARELEPDDEMIERIEEEEDPEILLRWMRRAVSVEKVEELFAAV
jgi:hypothetical protein